MAPKLALAALMALPALSMGAVLPEVDTRAANIVGGSKASSGQFPYIVTLTTSDALCGAVLINSNTILTASHCTFDESGNEIAASAYTIRAGSLVSKNPFFTSGFIKQNSKLTQALEILVGRYHFQGLQDHSSFRLRRQHRQQ